MEKDRRKRTKTAPMQPEVAVAPESPAAGETEAEAVAEAPQAAAPDAEDVADAQAEEAELMERLQEELRSLPVAEHVVYMMHSLSTLAVGRMGLAPDAKGRPDLDQARLAIDAFKALLEVVERARPGQMAAERSLLSQLQMAYVGVAERP